LALVVLSVVEQRLDAVRAVLAGASVVEVAREAGVSRQSVHAWIGRYLAEGVTGLADRSHRPKGCAHQAAPAVEAEVAEMRRLHARWGAKRISMELQRRHPGGVMAGGEAIPSERTINRILTRMGLMRSRPRKKPKSAFKRFERQEPMQLWQIDIVEGVWLVDVVTGELSEAKVVTGVDDHSRYCVIATVVRHATARAVCLAFAQALARFGVPQEIITDNGKQFTDRFGKGGEVLFAKICRKNGITHRPTAPASPNQNGKVERFHGTLRPEFLDTAGPFVSIAAAQAALDAWVHDYNTDRPHQGLDAKIPVLPADRFAPVPPEQRDVIDLWLPPTIAPAPTPPAATPEQADAGAVAAPSPVTEPIAQTSVDPSGASPMLTPAPADPGPGQRLRDWVGGPVEFFRVVPASGNMCVSQKQFWLGPARAGMQVRFWADTSVIHIVGPDGGRLKSLRSHLSETDLRRLVAEGATPAGPPPLPAPEAGEAIEVDRTVSRAGTITLAGRIILAAEILAGRRVGIRIEPATLMFFDLDTRELLRVRPNPISPQRVLTLRGARHAGPPPRPSTEPVRVQRRASNSGVLMVAGQKVALGRERHHQTFTIMVSETTLAIHLDDGEVRVVARTTTKPVRSIKEQRRPRTGRPSTITRHETVNHHPSLDNHRAFGELVGRSSAGDEVRHVGNAGVGVAEGLVLLGLVDVGDDADAVGVGGLDVGHGVADEDRGCGVGGQGGDGLLQEKRVGLHPVWVAGVAAGDVLHVPIELVLFEVGGDGRRGVVGRTTPATVTAGRADACAGVR
jgi:transposase InsO family protein